MHYVKPNLTGRDLENDFVNFSRRIIHQKENELSHALCFLSKAQKKQLIEKLYKEGFTIQKILKCSFQEFSVAIHSYRDLYSPKPNHQKKWDYPFQEKISYRKKPHHQKKEKDTLKKDWWDKKGFLKDKQNRHLDRGPMQEMMRRSHKDMRRMVRTKLASGDFEGAMMCDDLRDFFDVWMWD